MLIKISNLSKAYYSETKTITRALENISVDFKDKGLNFIVGESGSGKSTLLNIIGAIDTFDSGSIVVGGHSLKDLNEKELDYYRNSVVGFVFQELNLLEEFTVRDNIKLALDLNSQENEEKVELYLTSLGLKEIESNNVKNISTGQKQRVAIARTLIKNPSIIIADEPTGSLDSKNALEIMSALKQISKVKLVIVVTHDLDFAYMYGDRIIELKDGQVVKDIEKGLTKDNNIKELGNNLIKINKLDSNVVEKINEMKNEYNQKVYISSSKNSRKTKALFPKAIFDEDNSNDFKVSQRNKGKMKSVELKKSKLGLKKLFKLAISNLFNKKKILFLTIVLMVFSLLLYGLSEGLVNYNKIDAYVETINKENIKTINLVEKNGDSNKRIREANIVSLKEKYKDISIAKEYDLPLKINFNKTVNGTKKYTLSGVSEIGDVTKFGYTLLHGKNNIETYEEIIISEYFANLLIKGEYFENVKEISSIVNKEISLNNVNYKVVGIIESNYLANYKSDNDKLNSYSEIRDNLVFAKEGFMNNYYKNLDYIEYFLDIYLKDDDSLYDSNNLSMANVIFDSNEDNGKFTINYYEDNKNNLEENEILISESYLENNDMCREKCTSSSFNSELVFTYDSSILYSLNDYKVVGTYSYDGNEGNLSNLYSNSIIVSSLLKEDINKNIYFNNQLVIGLSENDSINSKFINEAYDLGLSINKNFTSLYNEYSEMVSELSDVLNTISIVLLVISIVLLFAFIQNSILISRRKIGILKSLGVRTSNIFVIFLLETLFVSLFTIVGASTLLLIASPLVNLVVRGNYGFYFSALNINALILFKITIITLFVSLLALIVPFIKFKKMQTSKLIGSR